MAYHFGVYTADVLNSVFIDLCHFPIPFVQLFFTQEAQAKGCHMYAPVLSLSLCVQREKHKDYLQVFL